MFSSVNQGDLIHFVAIVTILATAACSGNARVPSQPATNDDHLMPTDTGYNTLMVTLTPTQESFDEGSSVIIQTTVINEGSDPSRFCKYHTPFEGIANKIFIVKREGIEIPYQGMMKKRIAPTASDFMSLQPEEAVSSTVDISSAYNLPAGSYTISFIGSAINQLPNSPEVGFTIK